MIPASLATFINLFSQCQSFLTGYGNTAPHEIDDPVEFMLGLFHALGMETAMIVSPSMSGKYSIPLLRSNPEVFDGFIAVSPVNTASLTADEYKSIMVRELNTGFPIAFNERVTF